ncbi:hypothetical protein GGI26_002629 [Coemansia sp. RSA 1358]|uniref:Uncharacterized protein n=1 Tax=Coemansia umbellata TaxID=1424467 RepID=A0ABQ8PQD2_9FUNG|nr:hypothetical protein EDC05_001999 [Coemansia umbellata]KAJ2623214.1 hypothetical protein GGI26_002629 [Coemansia sp. RSA 1358]
MRTLMGIDLPESTHREKLLEAPSKPGTELRKKQTVAKARGSYRRYTPQQIKRLFGLVIEGRSAKEAALVTGISVRTAQKYVNTYRDDEQKRLPGIERKPRKGCPEKLNETHTQFLTQLVNQNPTAMDDILQQLDSILVPIFREVYRLDALLQDKEDLFSIKRHMHIKRKRQLDSKNGVFEHQAFDETLSLYAVFARFYFAPQTAQNKLASRTTRGTVELPQYTRPLKHVITEIAKTVAMAINGWARMEQHRSLLSRFLLKIVDIDRRYDDAYRLSTATMKGIVDTGLPARYLVSACKDVFEQLSTRVDALPESFIEALFALFSHANCFRQIMLMAKELTIVNPEIARQALCAIRNEQTRVQCSRHMYTSKSQHIGFGTNAGCVFRRPRNDWVSAKSHYSKSARRILLLLEQCGKQIVTSAYVAKLLEIDMAALDKSLVLPRTLSAFLRDFAYFGVHPDVTAMTIIINSYIEHGDSAFALWIFEQMESGKVDIGHGNGTSETIAISRPNDITVSTIAKAWCTNSNLTQIASLFDTMTRQKKPISQRLVTSVVSNMVDLGKFNEAEETWSKYGCAYIPYRSSTYEMPRINRRALAKLVIGYARVGNVDRAIRLLEMACDSERLATEDPAAGTSYLTGLLNIVLHECLSSKQDANGDVSLTDNTSISSDPLVRRDLHVIRMGLRCGGVRFNVTTYNMILARLSQASRALSHNTYSPFAMTDTDAERKKIIDAMQRLYERMLNDRILPNFSSLFHLIPMWVYIGNTTLALAHWNMYIKDKSPNKIKELKRHVVNQAKRWDIADGVIFDLLDPPS